MRLSDKQWLFLKDVAKLIIKAEQLGYKVTGGELYRTYEQQKIYVESGRSRTLRSKHLSRLAIDLNFFIRDENEKWKLTWKVEDIKPLGDYWESLDEKNAWGGKFRRFKDVPHFERQL